MLATQFGLALHSLPIESPTFPVSLSWRARDNAVAAQNWLRTIIREELLLSVAGVSGRVPGDRPPVLDELTVKTMIAEN
jgi:hypothetical protein